MNIDDKKDIYTLIIAIIIGLFIGLIFRYNSNNTADKTDFTNNTVKSEAKDSNNNTGLKVLNIFNHLIMHKNNMNNLK